MSVIQFSNRNKNVKYNESKVDVSHLSNERQREVLSLLRTGRDLRGRLRLVDGTKRLDDGRLGLERYAPSVDITGQLV